MALRDTIKDAMYYPNKLAKSYVDYSLGKAGAHCGICKYYSAHVCEVVRGHIDPTMWCKLFEKAE